MFYANEIMQRNQPMGRIYAACFKIKSLTRDEISDTDLQTIIGARPRGGAP